MEGMKGRKERRREGDSCGGGGKNKWSSLSLSRP